MPLWDYFISDSPNYYVGLTDEALARVRARHPRGRAVESVAHLPRVAGDDETDHIMRHRYGIDPASYRGVVVSHGAPVESAARAPRAVRSAAERGARRIERQRKRPVESERVVLSRGVRAVLRAAPGLAPRLEKIILRHLARGDERAAFIGKTLVMQTRSGKTRIFFREERSP